MPSCTIGMCTRLVLCLVLQVVEWGERMMIYPAQFGLVLCLVVLLVCVLDWSYA